jgi:uncharacterized membrane protein
MAGLLHSLHIVIAIFGALGFLIAPQVHAPFCAAVLVHWLTNNNRCIVSQLTENETPDTDTDKNGFTRQLLEMFGLTWPSAQWAQDIIPYALLIGPMLISISLTVLK